jgi:ABC-type branched-subunit amino acid transport system permease subunit
VESSEAALPSTKAQLRHTDLFILAAGAIAIILAGPVYRLRTEKLMITVLVIGSAITYCFSEGKIKRAAAEKARWTIPVCGALLCGGNNCGLGALF